MTLDEKVERSKSQERIDFSKISCLNQTDHLVKVNSSDKIRVEPVWEMNGDFEGRMYADYITDHHEYDGIYVRSNVLKRLQAAADSLSPQYQLVIHAGHRPIAVQKRLLRGVMDDYRKEHPAASDDEALMHARMFVSDPDIKLPPHCCGAAIDVELYDLNLKSHVDFGSPINMDDEISYLHAQNISQTGKDNRLLLLRTMLSAGFSSYYAEWWHFSYGDEIWAWFYRESSCLYGLAEPDLQPQAK